MTWIKKDGKLKWREPSKRKSKLKDKLTKRNVRYIRHFYLTHRYHGVQVMLAKKFGVSKVTINGIICRRIWKSV